MSKAANLSIVMDSITDADKNTAGKIVICGSHGGHYPAYLASAARVRGIVFNDAGGGMESAGIAGALALAKVGIAAATVSHNSCRIGDAKDMAMRGIISSRNDLAQRLGVEIGHEVAVAIEKLSNATGATGQLEAVNEARHEIQTASSKSKIFLMDSASLVSAEDEGHIVVTGSHGGLIGADPKRALKANARLAVFNDAGFGCDNAGIARLAALDDRRIAAITVAHTSAKIGDAHSTYHSGVISNINTTAKKAGLKIATPLKQALEEFN